MKKLLIGILCLMLFVGSTLPTFAQTSRQYAGRTAQIDRYDDRRYDSHYENRSVCDEHRDVITGAEAAIGGVTGGRKGAITGAVIGAGSSALYTYGIRDGDNDNRRRNCRRN